MEQVLTEKVEFRVRIADICFEIRCLYAATYRMCHEYLVEDDADAQETIIISQGDIDGERERLLRKKDPGQPLEASSPAALERLHLCRRIAELLPKYDRVLFHGSCLAFDGHGVLFTAKSGTGKSTHTRLWRQEFGNRVRMINDDKPFLHIQEKGITVYGTPWRGKHALGENISAPLDAILFVNRGEENRVEPVTARELYPLLLQQTYTPEDPAAMILTLGLVDRLSHGVTLRRLYCNMDPEAARVACKGINL